MKKPKAINSPPRTTLQQQNVDIEGKRAQKQPGQDLSHDQVGGPRKAEANHNRPSENS